MQIKYKYKYTYKYRYTGEVEKLGECVHTFQIPRA